LALIRGSLTSGSPNGVGGRQHRPHALLDAGSDGWQKGRQRGERTMPADNRMSSAQRAYEESRAKKAGKSLDTWLNEKQKRRTEATLAVAAAPPPKKPGFLSRLLDRAHKPL
jgi:hypothetical protein